MPKDTGSDQASGRAKPEPGNAHLRLLLSGDMGSPQEVLAEEGFSDADKREVFAVWLRDLRARPNDTETRRLIANIEEAMEMLGSEKARPHR
jgi:hypothetical protein